MADQPAPDWEGFGRAVMGYWPRGDVDAGDLQDLAENYDIILPVPGGYNPEKHEPDDDYGAEPGDPWFMLNY